MYIAVSLTSESGDDYCALVQADRPFEVVWGTHEQRAQWWKDRALLIGLWLKVKYQALYKGTLKPQFPVGVEFRACDENGNPVD